VWDGYVRCSRSRLHYQPPSARTVPAILTDDGISVTVDIILVRGWFSRAFRGIGLATHLLMMWKFGRVVYC